MTDSNDSQENVVCFSGETVLMQTTVIRKNIGLSRTKIVESNGKIMSLLWESFANIYETRKEYCKSHYTLSDIQQITAYQHYSFV
jgi:hypothetical protein